MRPASCLLVLLVLLSAAPGLAGTPRLARDIHPEGRNLGSDPSSFHRLGRTSLFSADDGISGRELWRSDGTAAGTFRITDVCGAESVCHPEILRCAGGRCYFHVLREGPDIPTQSELWATRGKPGDAQLLLSRPLRQAVLSTLWVPAQRRLYVTARDADQRLELWSTDGTTPGTVRIAGYSGQAPDLGRNHLTSFAGRVYFTADDGDGPALWSSDGTPAGTRLVKDFPPQGFDHGPFLLTVAGPYLFFIRQLAFDSFELWRSDGTTAGTVSISDFLTGTGRPIFYFEYVGPVVVGQRLFFVADLADRRGQELWVTDGTRRGTRRLTDFPAADAFTEGDVFIVLRAVDLNGQVFFTANDGPHGRELWKTDGTPQGTRLVRDVCVGPCSSGAMAVLPWANRGLLYFEAITGARGRELWITDGTAAGTRLVRDICRGPCGSDPRSFTLFKDRLYFGANNGAQRFLWRTDGTARGTVRVSDAFSEGQELLALPNVLLFEGTDAEHGTEPWRTDGTPEGTFLVDDIATTVLDGD